MTYTELTPKEFMELLSPNHCIIDVTCVHPVLGVVQVDRFQRTEEECEKILRDKTLLWQSRSLRVVNSRREDRPKGVTEGAKAWYYLMVDGSREGVKTLELSSEEIDCVLSGLLAKIEILRNEGKSDWDDDAIPFWNLLRKIEKTKSLHTNRVKSQ